MQYTIRELYASGMGLSMDCLSCGRNHPVNLPKLINEGSGPKPVNALRLKCPMCGWPAVPHVERPTRVVDGAPVEPFSVAFKVPEQ